MQTVTIDPERLFAVTTVANIGHCASRPAIAYTIKNFFDWPFRWLAIRCRIESSQQKAQWLKVF